MNPPNLVELVNETSMEFPDFRLRSKASSPFMRFLHVVLLILSFGKMKRFMHFTTTIGYTVYTPLDWDTLNPIQRAVVLRHERVHMRQARRYGRLLFSFLYLFFPLPLWRASYRTRFEMEAYEESMQALVDYGGDPSQFAYREKLFSHFTSAEYLWMWTRREDLEEWYNATLQRLMGRK